MEVQSNDKQTFDLFSRMSTQNPLKETSEGFFVLSGFVGQQEAFFMGTIMLAQTNYSIRLLFDTKKLIRRRRMLFIEFISSYHEKTRYGISNIYFYLPFHYLQTLV